MARSDFSIQEYCGTTLADPGVLRLPLVSFVLTRHADEDFGPTIDALRAQTYPRFEVIVVDAAATIASRATLESRIDGDPRFKRVEAGTDPGPFGRTSLGLAAAQGEFITFLDAVQLPLPGFACSHIQAHLASHHSIAFTASPIATEASARVEPSHPFLGSGSASPCLAPMLRLGCLDDESFARLASSTTLVEPTTLGWTASTGALQMYRRFLIDLLRLVDDAAEPPASADAYYAPLCQWLGGSAAIDVPLATRPPATASQAVEAAAMAGDRHKLAVWAENGSDFCRRIGPQRYWDALVLLLGQRPVMEGSPQESIKGIDHLMPRLSNAFGEQQAIQRLDDRLPRATVIALLKRHYGTSLPLRIHWALHSLGLHRMHQRIRQHLRTRRTGRAVHKTQ